MTLSDKGTKKNLYWPGILMQQDDLKFHVEKFKVLRFGIEIYIPIPRWVTFYSYS